MNFMKQMGTHLSSEPNAGEHACRGLSSLRGAHSQGAGTGTSNTDPAPSMIVMCIIVCNLLGARAG